MLKLSIGAPDGSDDRVSGVQTYVLSYDVKGTINAITDGQNAGLEEFYWNIFDDLDVRADAITVRISGSAAVRDIACYQGPAGQDARCTTSRSAGPSATFTFDALRAGDAATVMAAFPGGTFVNTEPILRDGRQRFLGLPPLAAIPAALVGGHETPVAVQFTPRRISARPKRRRCWPRPTRHGHSASSCLISPPAVSSGFLKYSGMAPAIRMTGRSR
ncbi:hypothetical protein BSZ39_12325 [Bowdeniella nasicola]|uniref:DUF2207 domain-containing protein n=1 Tax=Bowdeniella nasicola TaxID=208480 RepID=A0A1Q5PZY5_9ACTO|nr:DUF2207 domain-containing protein [Bowdeniella nasicola]OKL52920.1 hypothetical protein BSZ39_12325 [Bowdeniella nasicola]